MQPTRNTESTMISMNRTMKGSTTALDASARETGARLVRAARQLAIARTADQHAAAMEIVLELATPHAERVACLFVPSWPTEAVDSSELTAGALMEVAVAFSSAPRNTPSRLMAWLSSKLMDTMYATYVDAKRAARLHIAVSSNEDPEITTDFSTADSADEEERNVSMTYATNSVDGEDAPGTDSRTHRLHEVLSRLMAEDARLLSLRASGAAFETIGRLIGVSATTARRYHERALLAARRVAADLYDHAA